MSDGVFEYIEPMKHPKLKDALKPKALRSKELQEQEINTKMEVARRLLQFSAKLRS